MNVKAIVPEIIVEPIAGGFKISTNVAVDGQKVYVAAYDATNRVIAVGMADYAATGADVLVSANASYYKAFVFGIGAKPVIAEKSFN